MRLITAVWGIGFLVQVLIELGLARLLAPETVVTISPLMSVGATLLLIVFTRQRMRTAHARLELVEHLRWPL
ncbi:MAG TPA: hypothetical protein VEJ86_07845 [Candidatus Binataceae bacterium]|nr:hypothetical protein [Candidatus Binataceae bacterium]